MKKFVVRITPKKKYALVEFDSGYEKLPHEAVAEQAQPAPLGPSKK